MCIRDSRIYSVCYYDRSQQYYYMKRFTAEMSDKMQFFLDEEGQAKSGKDRIQPAGGEIFLIFAAAGDSYATVQSLFIGDKISLKRLLAAMIDADSGLTHTLVRKQPVKGGGGHIIIDTEGSLRTVGAA